MQSLVVGMCIGDGSMAGGFTLVAHDSLERSTSGCCSVVCECGILPHAAKTTQVINKKLAMLL